MTTYRRFIHIVLTGCTVVAVALFLLVALSRLSYPFAIEWLEGNTFLHVMRVLQGQPLYVAPNYDFITLIYTPLYYYISAPIAAVTGNIMMAMRLVSLLATLAAFAALYAIARAYGSSSIASLLAVGLFAAAYPVTGFWFDTAKSDMLSVALLLVAIALVVSLPQERLSIVVLSSVFLCLAFAAKQQAIFFTPFLVLHLLLQRWYRMATIFTVSVALLFISFVCISNWLSEGWFWFYIFVMPSAAPLLIDTIDDVLGQLLASYWPLAIILGLALIQWMRSQSWQLSSRQLSFVSLVVLLIGVSLWSVIKLYAYLNHLIFAAAGLALLGAKVSDYMLLRNAPVLWGQRLIHAGTIVLLITQFAELGYDPRSQIPVPEWVAEGYALVEELRTAPEPIFVPIAPYLLAMADRQTHFHGSSLGDLNVMIQQRPETKDVYQPYIGQINDAIRSARTAVLPNARWFDATFSAERGYVCEPLNDGRPLLPPLVGVDLHLTRMCLKK